MKIFKVKVSNILGIDALEVEPGKVNVISGSNGVGKTSLLEAIKAGLGGATIQDAELLRKGAKQGEIVLVLDDGKEITKTVYPDKASTIKIRENGRSTQGTPAALLGQLRDIVSVNPLSFMMADDKTRLAILLESLPIEIDNEKVSTIAGKKYEFKGGNAFDFLAGVKAGIFDARTGVNRALKDKKASIADLSAAVKDEEHLTTDEITEQIKTCEEHRLAYQKKMDEYQKEFFDVKTLKEENARAAYDKEYEALRAEFDLKVADLTERRASEIAEANNIYTVTMQDKQEKFNEIVEPIITQIAALQEKLKNSAQAEQLLKLIEKGNEEIAKYEKESEDLTESLTQLEEYKQSLLSSTNLEGLTIDDGQIRINGILYNKINTAEQIRFALRIARLRAGELGVVCVDGLEALDPETFEAFKNAMSKTDLQMFCTRVSGGTIEGIKDTIKFQSI